MDDLKNTRTLFCRLHFGLRLICEFLVVVVTKYRLEKVTNPARSMFFVNVHNWVN